MPDQLEQRTYEVSHVLGKGGFGTVYRARLRASGGFTKEVALKVLNPELASSEDVVRRLRDEARMLGLLRHRAIVHVDGLIRIEDRWAIVMEFVDGASLRDVLDNERVPPGVALEICEEVAAALEVAYDKPVASGEPLRLLHRDIKPGNIQLTARGEVKLLDFGVAKADFGAREAETRSLIFGSINYLAPERMDFEDTHSGDMYALGVTLYEMLMGEPLGKASVNPRKHNRRVEDARQALVDRLGDRQLADLVASTLLYEPEDRPDARVFERAARELRRGYPQPWLRDWAEHAVVEAMATRRVEHDGWSGSTLNESSGALAESTLAFGRDSDDEDEPKLQPASLDTPPGAKPAEPAAPAAPEDDSAALTARERVLEAKRRRRQALRDRRNDPERQAKLARAREILGERRRRTWRRVIAITGTLLVLLVLVVVVVPIVATGGLVWLLDASGIWDQAWTGAVIEDFQEMDQQVHATAPSAERDALLDVIRPGQDATVAERVGMFEIIELETAVEKAVADGLIDPAELADIRRIYAEITAD